EKTAQLLPGNVSPIFPEQLKLAGVEGKVLAQFVVDTTGIPLTQTFRIVERSDDRFVPSVREVVPNLRFSPAEVGGRKVKQLVSMPFSFLLGKDGPEGANASVEFNVRQLQPTREEGSGPKFRGDATLPKGVYLEYQVERPVAPLPNNQAPRYPDAMR